jgi:hypothetical protein
VAGVDPVSASMTPEKAKALREPFKPEQIGKLPKPTKKENEKGRCSYCCGWHGLPAVHLDYVGHAATTDRLLQVDPEWSWEPMAVGTNGEPLMTNGGMWIWLTVCGVRRPGFGDGQSTKEIIGDAIRNAAMRFGVALDLWAKEDLSATNSLMQDSAASPTGEVRTPSPTAVDDAHVSPVSQAVSGEPAFAAEEDDGLFPPLGVSQGLTIAQAKKLNVLVGRLRGAGHITTEQLWRACSPDNHASSWPRDEDGELHWSPLRDSLTKDEASALIERLTRLEERVAVPAYMDVDDSEFARLAADAQARRVAT